MIQSVAEEGCFHETQLILVASCPLSLLCSFSPTYHFRLTHSKNIDPCGCSCFLSQPSTL